MHQENKLKELKTMFESELWQQFFARNLSDVIWIVDLDLNYIYLSPSAGELSGYSRDELSNLTPADILTPASMEKAMTIFGEELSLEEAGSAIADRSRIIEVEQVHQNGSTVWVELNGSFVRDDSGKPIGLFGITRDIDSRKKVEEALLYQNNKMQLLFEISKAMAIKKEIRSLSQVIVDGITKLTNLGSAAIYLHDGSELKLEATSPPLPADFPDHFRIAPLSEHPHLNRALVNKQILVIEDIGAANLTAAEREVSESRNLRAQLFVPLIYQDNATGVLIVADTNQPHKFAEDEIAICQTLAGLASLSLREAYLAEQQQQNLDDLKQINANLLEAEKAARESEGKYKQIADNMSDVVWIADAELNTIYVSPSIEKLIGESADDHISRSLEEKLPPESLNTLLLTFQEEMEKEKDPLYDKNRTRNIEIQHYKADGNFIWVSMHISALRDNMGNIKGFQGVTRDITERKKAEAEQLQANSLLNATLESTADGLLVVDNQGIRRLENNRFVDMWRIPQEILDDKNDETMLNYVLEQLCDPDEFLAIVQELYRHPEAVSSDTLYLTDGRVFDRYSQPQKINNEIVGRVWSFRDVTEYKKAEAEILRLNEDLEERVRERTVELQAVNKELESFAYSVSHDFRAPLRALDGFSASLTEKYSNQLDEQGLHYLRRIRNAAIYMSNLVDDLLKLSRVTRTDIKKEHVNLSKLAAEIVASLQEIEPDRKVEILITADLTAKGDPHLLQVVLNNLLGNAWKFSLQEAQAKIEVGRSVIDGENVFFVRDNGVGFNLAYADKLFGAFQRLHRTDEFPGTGIGLSIVLRIIERHGGRIWAESEVGKGATFYFTLPG